MRPWRSKHGSGPPLDDDAYFEQVVRDMAPRLSMTVLHYDPSGEVELTGMSLAGTVDLRNVRQLCRGVDRSAWGGILVDHLAGLAQVRSRPRGYDNLDRVRPLLRSRLYAEAEFLLDDVEARPVAPGVVEALVVSEAGTIATLPRTQVESWHEPLEELYRQARAQVRAEGLPQVRDVDVDGAVLHAVESPSFFTATSVFWLPELVDVPADGALVALPTRHLLLVHPIGDATVVPAVQAMVVNAYAFHDQGPGSLSPHLYWWRAGTLSLLPATVDPDRVTFRPPPDFAAVLRRLGG
jgi:hypothetical protein